MAVITGLTAERMEEIEAASVIDGEVVGNNLILARHDGSTIDAGNVRGPIGAKPPFVTSLPSSPTDLDEIYFQTTAMAALNIAWHMVYRSGPGKWQYLGGPEWTVQGVGGQANGTMENTTSLNAATLTTAGPKIVVPATGLYTVRGSAISKQVGTSSAPCLVLWKTGDSAANWANADSCGFANYAGAIFHLVAKKNLTLTAAADVELRYATSNTTGGSSFNNRSLSIVPITLG